MVFMFSPNMLHENINIMQKNREALLQASREVGLEVNAEEAKCIFISLHQNAGQNHNLMTANSLKNVAMFKYLGMPINQNYIHEEIKSRLNSGDACHHSAQNVFQVFLKIGPSHSLGCLRKR